MKKKLFLIMSTMLVCACVLAGCREAEGSENGNADNSENVETEIVIAVWRKQK